MDKPGASSSWAPGSNMNMNEAEQFQFLYEFLYGQPSHKTYKITAQPRQKVKPHKLTRSSPSQQ